MIARKQIAGALDYRLLAKMHRPAEPEQIRAEIRRLHREQHLSPRDIATALQLSEAAVTEALSALGEGK